MTTSDIDRGYILRLVDGTTWNICSLDGAASIAREFASVMELDRCSEEVDCPKLIFAPRGPVASHTQTAGIFGNIRSNGWQPRDFGSCRMWFNSKAENVIVELIDTADEVSAIRCATWGIFQRAMTNGGLPFHAALVKRHGKGILLGGPSGKGKSTCCSRIPAPWRAMCDDQVLLLREGRHCYQAHPFPTLSNLIYRRPQRQWNVEESVPLKTICFLQQSDRNALTQLGPGEAAIYMYESAKVVFNVFLWDRSQAAQDAMATLFDNTCALANAIPSYELEVSLTGEFWKELEQLL